MLTRIVGTIFVLVCINVLTAFSCEAHDQAPHSVYVFSQSLKPDGSPIFESIKARPWLSNEQQITSDLFDYLHKLRPGLIRLATLNKPIFVFCLEKSFLSQGRPSLAVSYKNQLFLSPGFFSCQADVRLHCFVHEIVHIADGHDFISMSPAWIKIASPFISAGGVQYKSNLWPSSYATQDLREALAEYTASYVTGNYYPSRSLFESETSASLFGASVNQIRWENLFFLGRQNIENRDLKNAIKYFARANAMYPAQPLPSHYIAICYAQMGDLVSTQKVVFQMIQKFDSLGLPASDETKIRCLKLIVDSFFFSKKYDRCLTLIDSLLIRYPNEAWLNEKRLSCIQRQGPH